jgi:ankyrin repeat protein
MDKRLLASGADPNAGAYGTPLNAAALRNGNAEIIRALIAAGAKPDGRGEVGNACWVSPLAHAAWNGDVENARALLDAGASLDQPRCSKLIAGGLTRPILDLLVEHGLDFNAVDEDGKNGLHLALAPPFVPRVESIEYLLQAGVPVNARDRRGKTPLAYWREERVYERQWFTYWLFDWLGNDSELKSQRANRAKISTLLRQWRASM